jgi:integrase
MKRPPRKVRFTDITVRNAKGETGVYNVWDTKQHGLCLRVQPSGGRAFYAVYSRQGRPRWLRLGDARDLGLAEARTMAAETMLDVVRGKDPVAEKRAQRSSGTFAELVQRYFDEYAKKRKRSWRQADALVRRFALPRWGQLAASAITRGDVKAMMATIEKPSVATQTILHVSAIFSWAMHEDILPANPCRRVAEKTTNNRERVLAESEVAPFWHALDDVDRVHALALRMILITGQRPGEVAHMRREHIVDNWWQMPGDPVPALGWPGLKNSKSHRVWLSAPAQAILAELSDDDDAVGFVFANARGGPSHRLDGTMRELGRKMAIERATPHDLRRTNGTMITSLGFGRDGMNRVQNHIEGGVTDIYDRHKYATENKAIMEAVAAKIMGLVEGRPDSKVVQFSPRQ